jgi:hypothetical protein
MTLFTYLLNAEKRAEVLKAQITEREATRREREKTRQTKAASNEYQTTQRIVRVVICVLAAITVIAMALDADSFIDAWHDVAIKSLQSKNPSLIPTVPPPPPVFTVNITPAPPPAR